jgi:hypothetical protein
MRSEALDALATRFRIEAAEDYVGLWSVVRGLRALMPDVEDNIFQVALDDLLRGLLDSPCVFGEFVDELGFVTWPDDQVVNQLLLEVAALDRDPDIGEIGWFVIPAGAQQ